MPFGEAKRRFLVRVLGEKRTKALEDALPVMESRLEQAGIGWKSLQAALVGPESGVGFADDVETVETVVVAVVPAGPTTFAEAEAEEAAREEAAETRSLTATFDLLIGNIMNLPTEDQAERVALLEKVVGELKVRLGSVGQKAGGFGGAKYVADLLAGSGVKSLNDEAAQEVEELHGPAAGIVRDLLRQGAVQQG